MKGIVFISFFFTLSATAGIFEENHPKVAEGMAAYKNGDFEVALRKFEEAKKELPNSAVLEFNMGNALFKLGRMQEAQAAFSRVQKLDAQGLNGRDFYNMGNTLAQMEKTDEAIRAFQQALLRNPKDDAARHNLEVLLRRKNNTPDAGQDAGTDAGMDAGMDGGQDGGSDAGTDGGTDGGSGGGSDGGADGGTEPRDGGSQEKAEKGKALDAGIDLSKQEAEKILDSIRNSEKNLQLWRFQEKKRRRSEKDW